MSNLVIKNQYLDSNNWELVKPRKTDIVIASCYKSGTTLTQVIVNLLVNGHDNFERLSQLSPWIDDAVSSHDTAFLESLPERRFFKTHLPFDALPHYRDWKYIYLGRDGRDVGLSLYTHLQHLKAFYLETSSNPPKDHTYGSDSFSEFWDKWLETGEPRWSFWEHINNWWQAKHFPNVLLVHYADLINDKPREVKKIADFLNIKLDLSLLNLVLERSDIKYMKQNWTKLQSPGVPPNILVNKGTNGRWQNVLTPEHLSYYETFISKTLEPECANWVKNGDSFKSDEL